MFESTKTKLRFELCFASGKNHNTYVPKQDTQIGKDITCIPSACISLFSRLALNSIYLAANERGARRPAKPPLGLSALATQSLASVLAWNKKCCPINEFPLPRTLFEFRRSAQSTKLGKYGEEGL